MENIIILAAGVGSRMKSSTPKVLHKICGKTMFEVVLNVAKEVNSNGNIVAVASEENCDKIKELYKIEPVVQKERLGTGHAVLTSLPKLKGGGRTLILYGDTPLIKPQTLLKMLKVEAEVVVLGFEGEKEERYGRLIQTSGDLKRIVEFKDATAKEREITLYNSGIFLIKTEVLQKFIPLIKNNNEAKEYYLTDIVELVIKNGLNAKYMQCEREETMGVNTSLELAKCESVMQDRLRETHLLNGVTMHDPKTVYFSFDTKCASDVVIEQNVVFKGEVEVGPSCTIKAFSYIEDCIIKNNVNIGPFARIRGKTVIEEECKIGNFVEVKNSHLKKDVKAGHLAYIGDAEVGQDVNIGAGVVFCNYDGITKYKTKVGESCFIGSNSSLVAPLEVAKKTLVAAGSVITKNTKQGSLVIERSKEMTIEGFFDKKFKKD